MAHQPRHVIKHPTYNIYQMEDEHPVTGVVNPQVQWTTNREEATTYSPKQVGAHMVYDRSRVEPADLGGESDE